MGLVGGWLSVPYHGGITHLAAPLEFMLRPALWLQMLSQYRATITVAPNFAYSLVARKLPDRDLQDLDLSALRLAFNGAEPVDADTAERFAERLAPRGLRASAYYPVYGLAEATLAAAFPVPGTGVSAQWVVRQDFSPGRTIQRAAGPGPGTIRLVSVGGALPGHSLEIVHPDTSEVLPDRTVGEIVVKGPSISPYYFDAAHVMREDRRHALRTGDLGYLDGGQLFIVDRLKDLVIVAGRCFSPCDLERAVEKVRGIRAGRVVAFSLADVPQGTEALVMVAEARPELLRSRRLMEEEVRGVITREVGLGVADVLLVNPGALARTSSGKIMRRDTRERYCSGALDSVRASGPLDPARLGRSVRLFVSGLLARRSVQGER
jgi:acyl-CoA synthetase (AMP-forming)/AMP-acid ligase II